MRILTGCAFVVFFLACLAWTQQPAGKGKSSGNPQPASAPSSTSLNQVLESNVKAEWDAFKKKDKQAYSNLLADDFTAIEDDGEGMRKKTTAVAEIDKSVIHDYKLFALTTMPIDANAALVTYEITFEFPPGVQVRFKRVFVSELWLKRNGEWKERFYQETRVR